MSSSEHLDDDFTRNPDRWRLDDLARFQEDRDEEDDLEDYRDSWESDFDHPNDRREEPLSYAVFRGPR